MQVDSVVTGSEPGRIRSVDVWISKAAPGIPRLRDEEQGLIVDILSIEVSDPREME